MSERAPSGDGVVASEVAFTRLASTRADSPMLMRDTDVEIAEGFVAHALVEDAKPALLVPVGAETNVPSDRHSQGVALSRRVLRDGAVDRHFLQVVCEVKQLRPTFSALCDDLLAALATDASGAPASVCIQVLDAWRHLLAPRPSELLSRSALVGLLAELHVAENLVREDPNRLSTWHGPEAHRHDFVGQGGAVEVKASTNADRFTIEIHGARQLEAPSDGQLALHAERFEPSDVAGDSVPDCVDRIRAHGVSALDLLTKMTEVGYDARHADAYRLIRFVSLETRTYAVDEKFPAITAAQLRDGAMLDSMLNVRYGLDLDSAGVEAFRCSSDLVSRVLVAR